MIILVPTCEHVDRTAELCDYSSWRRRGWCRLELMGSQLSRSQLRVMLCNGGLAQPVLLTPIDIIHLLPGMGSYTCCARNHGEQGCRSVVVVVACEEHLKPVSLKRCAFRVSVAYTCLFTHTRVSLQSRVRPWQTLVTDQEQPRVICLPWRVSYQL